MFSVRWSIVRLIWLREMRDQLRDRRTMTMILVLPLLIYPLAGLGLMQLTLGMMGDQHTIGILGVNHLPEPTPRTAGMDAPQMLTWLSMTPDQQGVGQIAGAMVFQRVASAHQTFPPLLNRFQSSISFQKQYFPESILETALVIQRLSGPIDIQNPAPLRNREIDVLLVVPANFQSELMAGRPGQLFIKYRKEDAESRLAAQELLSILSKWMAKLKETKFARQLLPANFDMPVQLVMADEMQSVSEQTTQELYELMLRIFPIILVMWSLAGALYPAVDLCAGEKERGTMETLLISPAQREEIVFGKFFAIWVFSAATALLNLLGMGITAWQFSGPLGQPSIHGLGILWCVLLILPLSAFFSAICLSIGAYARSTKEGQYYLMPLFLVSMPLVLVILAPGIVLSPLTSLVPVTGVSLLLYQLLSSSSLDQVPWLYFIPVLVPMVIYSLLALRWAVEQFKSENVLFREVERLELRLWLKRVLREKEPRPSTGQALFCFAMMIGLTWFTLGLGQGMLIAQTVRYLAFVATPTLLMAILLTTQPRESLAIRLPTWWSWPVALALVILLLPTLAQVTLWILHQFPVIYQLIEENEAVTAWVSSLPANGASASIRPWLALLVFAWLPAICEELAFRGFILTGLQRRFRPRTAVALSSLLFALFHLNVFQMLPTFLLGMILAYLTTRCGSILPSMLFHVLYNTLILVPVLFPDLAGAPFVGVIDGQANLWIVTVVTAPLAIGLLWWLTTHQPHPAYVAFLESDPSLLASPSQHEAQ